jgi:hypothetical protein
MKIGKRAFWLMLILCWLLPGYGSATVVKPLNLLELTDEADLIFRGKVICLDSRWDEGRSSIWTYVTFLVEELIKGRFTEDKITLRLPGGAIEAENIRLRVDGVP